MATISSTSCPKHILQLTHEDEQGNKIITDIAQNHGGSDKGFRPMQLLLAALSACSEVDIVHILQKQKQSLTSIRIVVEGEREANKNISIWKDILIRYEATGSSVDPDKLIRAIQLSLSTYCSVAETLRKAGAVIQFKAFLNNKEIIA